MAYNKSESGEKKKFYTSQKWESRDKSRDYKKKKHTYTAAKTERIAPEADDVIGVYAQWKWDYGFVDVETQTENWVEKQGYYVFGRNSMNAMTGDKVLAKVKEFNGKKEAVIRQIIRHRKEPVVGVFTSSGFVLPNDTSIKKDIFVPGKLTKDAKDWDVVAVEIMKWEGRSPEGKIIKILGKKGEKGVDILGMAMEAGMRIDFGRSLFYTFRILQRLKIKSKKSTN